jgi:hypothetical protein
MGNATDEVANAWHESANDVATTSLTREEIRDTVRQEILAMSAASGSTSSATESQPAPPSYDASARLLDSEPADAGPSGTDDVENVRKQDKQPLCLRGAPVWIRVIFSAINVIVLLSPFIFMIVLSGTGNDPLGLGSLSLFLFGAQLVGYLIVPVSKICLLGSSLHSSSVTSTCR